MLLSVLFVPAGLLASAKGPAFNLKVGAVGLLVVAVPAFAAIAHYRTTAAAAAAQTVLCAFVSIFGAGAPHFVVNAFPVPVRMVCAGIAYVKRRRRCCCCCYVRAQCCSY